MQVASFTVAATSPPAPVLALQVRPCLSLCLSCPLYCNCWGSKKHNEASRQLQSSSMPLSSFSFFSFLSSLLSLSLLIFFSGLALLSFLSFFLLVLLRELELRRELELLLRRLRRLGVLLLLRLTRLLRLFCSFSLGFSRFSLDSLPFSALSFPKTRLFSAAMSFLTVASSMSCSDLPSELANRLLKSASV